MFLRAIFDFWVVSVVWAGSSLGVICIEFEIGICDDVSISATTASNNDDDDDDSDDNDAAGNEVDDADNVDTNGNDDAGAGVDDVNIDADGDGNNIGVDLDNNDADGIDADGKAVDANERDWTGSIGLTCSKGLGNCRCTGGGGGGIINCNGIGGLGAIRWFPKLDVGVLDVVVGGCVVAAEEEGPLVGCNMLARALLKLSTSKSSNCSIICTSLTIFSAACILEAGICTSSISI